MPIRPFRPEDAPALAILFQRAVREVGSRDYTAAQVEAWAGGSVEQRAANLGVRLSDGRLALVAVDGNGNALAFGDLEADGHIDFLYAAPEAIGKGIAAALCDALERVARERGITRLYSEASEAARRLFLKKGFTVLHRRDFEVRGVPIHNYAMEKRLSGTTRVYSDRLGAISDAQFQAAADRFALGRFVKAEPTTSGLFGQNVFVTTTEGDFVLRGAPHWVKRLEEKTHRRQDRWQFTSEKFFAEQLHTHTKAPVPWPMLHDETSDVFGWPYLVMPKMPGHCFGERDILTSLSAEDRHGVAVALGAMLAEMQRLTAPFAGGIDIDTLQLTPFPDGFTQHAIAELRVCARDAEASGALADEDRQWIEDAEHRALAAGTRPDTYVHCDYKLNNLTVSKSDAGWRVTGLFDLHEAKYGDGALDLVRQACSYLDTEPALARVFVETYRERVPADPRLAASMPLYILNDRMKLWSFFTRPGSRADWTEGKTFRGWATRYVEGVLALL